MKRLTDYLSSTATYVVDSAKQGAKYGALALTTAAVSYAANPLANKIDLTNLYKSNNNIVKVGSNPGEQAAAAKKKKEKENMKVGGGLALLLLAISQSGGSNGGVAANQNQTAGVTENNATSVIEATGRKTFKKR